MHTFLSHLKFIGIWIFVSIILISIAIWTGILEISIFVVGISLIALGFYIFWFLGFLPGEQKDARYKGGHKPGNPFFNFVNLLFGLPALCAIILGIALIFTAYRDFFHPPAYKQGILHTETETLPV